MKRLFRSVIAVVLALFMLLSTASALTVEEALGLLEESYLREIPEEALRMWWILQECFCRKAW